MSTLISKQYFDFLCHSELNLGFFGGSFNPFHAGHANLIQNVIKILNLDCLILLVAHYSHVKTYDTSASYRAEMIAKNFFHPKVYISFIEEELGYNYSALIAKYIINKSDKPRYMIFGADSLIYFHQWEYYEYILNNMKVVVVDRPGYTYKALNSKAIKYIHQFIRIKQYNISSTQIRNNLNLI